VIALPGQETAAGLAAELGTEALLADNLTDLFLAAVGDDAEAALGLAGEELTAAAEPGGAMLDPAADARADELAAKTGLILRKTRQELGHGTPPCASSPRGELPAFICSSYPAIVD